jgi:hypothetical protein
MAKKSKRWIQRALKRHKRGALHRQMGIPQGETIPLRSLQTAAKKPGLLGKRARLALNLRKIRRKRT